MHYLKSMIKLEDSDITLEEAKDNYELAQSLVIVICNVFPDYTKISNYKERNIRVKCGNIFNGRRYTWDGDILTIYRSPFNMSSRISNGTIYSRRYQVCCSNVSTIMMFLKDVDKIIDEMVKKIDKLSSVSDALAKKVDRTSLQLGKFE